MVKMGSSGLNGKHSEVFKISMLLEEVDCSVALQWNTGKASYMPLPKRPVGREDSKWMDSCISHH
jgi:hypothetical protein